MSVLPGPDKTDSQSKPCNSKGNWILFMLHLPPFFNESLTWPAVESHILNYAYKLLQQFVTLYTYSRTHNYTYTHSKNYTISIHPCEGEKARGVKLTHTIIRH